jgi:transposase-like protein
MALRVDAGKEKRWLDLVKRWQRSQLSIREFCRRHQLNEPNFYAWRRVLRERGLIQDAPVAASLPAFVKLEAEAAPMASAIEVVVGPRVLRVRPGFDADLLLKLVQLLEERPC